MNNAKPQTVAVENLAKSLLLVNLEMEEANLQVACEMEGLKVVAVLMAMDEFGDTAEWVDCEWMNNNAATEVKAALIPTTENTDLPF